MLYCLRAAKASHSRGGILRGAAGKPRRKSRGWKSGDYSRGPNEAANGRECVIRLIHITDPHLTSLDGLSLWRLRGKRWSGYLSWRRRRRHVHLPEVLQGLIEAVHAENPVQILVTGDLVHVGMPEEIRAAARWLETLGPPGRVMLVPGNHDVYARDSWPALAREWQTYLRPAGAAGRTFPACRHLADEGGGVSLIGLSSAVPSPPFMAYGSVGQEQRDSLACELDRAPGFRCVLIHHPPLPGMTHPRKGLKDSAALESVLGRHGAELVLHGHVHRNVGRMGPGNMRVYGTASASSAAHGDPASYRSFDVEPCGSGWRVRMRLVTVDATGAARVAQEEVWQAPFRPAASASASASASGPSTTR